MTKVAIIGAGPSGLATGRWLKHEGFEPVLYEQGDTLGGQWSADSRYSGIWPSMHTNTCREMTQFSDLRHEAGTPLYPGHRTMLSYLTRYAERFDLPSRIRLRTRVTRLTRHSNDGWTLRGVSHDGIELEDTYPYVVVASGRFNKPKFFPMFLDSPHSAVHVASPIPSTTRIRSATAAAAFSLPDAQ